MARALRTSRLEVAASARSLALPTKLPPDGRVIGWIFSLAHLAIDPGGNALFHQLAAGQQQIDAQAAVFRESQHPIVPPAKELRFRMECSNVS